MGRPVFELRVPAERGVSGGPSAYQRLRAWLKRGLRDFGLECTSIEEQTQETNMPIDLNEADIQRDRELIEPGVYGLEINVKEGHGGTDGWLKLAKNQRSLMLQLECTVINAVTAKGEVTSSEYAGKVV